MKLGQINRGSKLGEIIYNLVKQDDIKTILETGTWTGLGSTKCIYDGIIDSNKKDFLVYSFECNFLRFMEAQNNLAPLMKGFNIINGTIISSEQIEYHKEKEEVKNSNMIKWLAEDIEHMNKCLFLGDKVTNKIWDLVILDGSEFTGDEEFNLIKNNFRYLILDDTRSYKHCRNREFILNNKNTYNVITDDLNDRGGFILCQKI
jgi:hypothetical protein